MRKWYAVPRIFIVLFAVFYFFMNSCTEKNPTEVYVTEEPPQDNGRVIATIHGVVTDANTQVALPNVSVSYFMKDSSIHTTTTDTLGYYQIGGLGLGNYELTFVHSGHATARLGVNVDFNPENYYNAGSDSNYHFSVVGNVEMFQLNSSLIGKIYAEKNPQNIVLAKGAEVQLDLSGFNLDKALFFASTNDNGEFLIENIPSVTVPQVNLTIMPYTDGDQTFAVQVIPTNLLYGAVSNLGTVILKVAGDNPIIMANNFEIGKFPPDGNLELTFSKKMDPNRTNFNLTGPSAGQMSISWDADNIKVTLDPNFDLQTGSNYNLHVDAWSIDNHNLIDDIAFETEEGINIVSTNLLNTNNTPVDDFPVDGSIEVEFSMAADMNNPNTEISLKDREHNFQQVMFDATWSQGDTKLTIHPIGQLKQTNDYRLELDVYSGIEGDHVVRQYDFRTAVTDDPPSAVSGFALNEGPGWTADYDTRSINFEWNTTQNADGYRIFAKDTHNNPDWILIDEFGNNDYMQIQEHQITLPAQFDFYSSDGFQTPFSGGTVVSFQIQAYNAAGDGPLSSNPLDVKDETPPTINFTLTGNADNTSGTNPVFTIDLVNPSEYLSTDPPTFTFVETGGDPNFVLTSGAVTWAWRANTRQGGEATLTIPDGQCAAGDTVIISNIKDNSGNVAEPDTFLLRPDVRFNFPLFGDTLLNRSATIDWNIVNANQNQIQNVDVLLSLDGGITFIDTLGENIPWFNDYFWNPIADTLLSDRHAKIGVVDHMGGYVWKSDLFSIAGIHIISPLETISADTSDQITIEWESFAQDSVIIEWRARDIASGIPITAFTGIDTVMSSVGQIPWTIPVVENPPGTPVSYECEIQIRRSDGVFYPRDAVRFLVRIF